MSTRLKFGFLFFKRNAVNILFGCILLFVAAQRVPSVVKMYEAEGKSAQSALAFDLSGQSISIPLPTKHILVFWATWCGPCGVELGRINKMIVNGEIASESVLAVSIAEDPKLVSSFVKEKKYLFKVAVDQSGQAAGLYRVSGTPTILFIGSDRKVNWMTTGLSPSLEFRIRSFLKN